MEGKTVGRILRGIGAVVVGLAVATVTVVALTWAAVALMLDGDMAASPTPAYLAVNLGYSFAAAVLGGWLAARVAAVRPVLHAGIVGAVMLLLALGGEGGGDGGTPAWYGTAIGLLGATGALLGGWVRSLRMRLSEAPETAPPAG